MSEYFCAGGKYVVENIGKGIFCRKFLQFQYPFLY